MKVYTHLSFEERSKIALWQEEGLTEREMAEELGRDKSTIYREISRNTDPGTGKYVAMRAEHSYKRRIKKPQGRIRDKETRLYVRRKMLTGWSPERISGRIRMDKPGKSVSHETIYMYIYKESPELRKCLPRYHMKRHLRGQRKTHRKSHIPNRVLIDFRPKAIDSRKDPGHWESDVMMGLKEKNSGVTFAVERNTRFTRARKLNDVNAALNRKNITTMLKGLHRKLRQSITYDNGKENTEHEQINAVVGCKSYFCHAGRPYEKGSVENTIGLARRVFPKRTDFDNISAYKIQKMEDWLNDLPRKCLGWKTPREAFNQLCCT